MRILVVTVVSCLCALIAGAQGQRESGLGRKTPEARGLTEAKQITERGKHHAVWEWIEKEQGPDGHPVSLLTCAQLCNKNERRVVLYRGFHPNAL